MNCSEKFEQIYHKSPTDVSFCPYRVCPIGAHSDHNLGKVTGFAIDKGIHIAYAPKQNGVVELASLQFPKRAQWHVRSVSDTKQGDWADYLRGVTIELGQRFPLRYGISGVIEGTLPIGGLSSSAAVCIAFLKALCVVNGIQLDPREIIAIAMAAENNYVGVSSGKLDQSCEVYSRKGHMLYLDCKDDSYELIPVNPAMKPFEIAVFFSGVERNLAGSAFNMRVDEARSAASHSRPSPACLTASSRRPTCATWSLPSSKNTNPACRRTGASVPSTGTGNSPGSRPVRKPGGGET